MIVIIAKLLRKAGRQEMAMYLLDKFFVLFPGSVSAFREYCINRMSLRDFLSVIERCRLVAEMPGTSQGIKEAATFWLTRANLEDKPDQDTLKSLQNSFQIASCCSKDFLAEGKNEEALDSFGESLKLAGVPGNAIPEWKAAFDLLGEKTYLNDSPSGTEDKSVPVLAVSGMYWSGSGAVYAYLREFDQVSEVQGELRLWKEGDFSLNSLSRRVDNHEEFKPGLQKFLFTALTGTGPIHNWQEQMASYYALKAARNDSYGLYARVCRTFIEEALTISGKNKFTRAAARFSNNLALLWGGTDGKTVLFDNIVHIGEIEAVSLLGDTKVLCVFRDPRSNFVARWYENPRFHRDVDQFIAYYRDTVQSFNSTVSGAPAEFKNVMRVSFESFIRSEKYRNTIADFCDLDLKKREEGKFFKPSASLKNTTNYRKFPDQTAIRKIEQELGEYCTDELTGD